jgi:predicted XRE-type DNA-binding protein
MTAPSIKVRVRFRSCRRDDEPAPVDVPDGPTAIARRMALAFHIENLIERGELRDYAEAAERLGVSRARITQICDLALLAPDIQAAVLLGQVEPRDRHLREVGRHPLWADQMRAFHQLFPDVLEDDEHDRS